MSLLDCIHGGYVHQRRVHVLAERIAPVIPPHARVLDVGCGDGLLASLIAAERPDISIEGIDVLVRAQTHVPVKPFDGTHIDAPDRSFDAVLFVDVLHHTDDPEVLVTEAARVAKDCVIIKDHTQNGVLARPTLRMMDWVSNARHGVRLPYNYWPKNRWNAMLERRGLRIESWVSKIGLYPWWASWVFERELHFIAKLAVTPPSPG